MTAPRAIFAVPVLLLWFASLPTVAQPRCGGTERWLVKTGVDPDASKVDVKNVTSTTVRELNTLPSLRDTVPRGDNQLRLSEERAVYAVEGRLVMFKNEDDSDYHLVITDDSLNYTPGGHGTEGLDTGTSFIAEIPDPDCAAGRKGPSGARSHWDAQLKAVRAKFEARFPAGQGADADLGGIPVTITGVLFYDRQHLQTGRATNGVELHPLLDLQFRDGGASTPVPTNPSSNDGDASRQILANTGFEEGVTAWSGTVADIGTYEAKPARTGNYFAWMGGTAIAHTEGLYQNVSIPRSVNSVTLSFWLSIETDETTTTRKVDKLYVQIRGKGGRVLKTLDVFSNLDSTDTYKKHNYDIPELAGKDVSVFLKVVEDDGKVTSFSLDDFALTAK